VRDAEPARGAGQELAARAVEQSDVLVENFRPGTLERWNLAPERLWEANPGLVIARVSGYGQTGPYAPRAGFASVSEAMGGSATSTASRRAAAPHPHLARRLARRDVRDAGILAALYRRDALGGGRGQVWTSR
jgi:Predicted acyl-CoA transferases/carnitine dehydratase